MSQEKVRLLTIVGQSGSGKTTQMRELVAVSGFRMCPSVTTRQPRETDIDHEYRYMDLLDYKKMLSIPGRLLWDITAGNGDSYSKDTCDVIEAFCDPTVQYVNALVPECAAVLARRYSQHVRTVFLPSPDDDELLARMALRGDDIAKAQERITSERAQDWPGQIAAIEGVHIIKAATVAERHQELLDFIS